LLQVNELVLAVEHAQALRHVLDGGFEALALQFELRMQLLAIAAAELIELFDHQGDRALRPPAIAIGLVVSGADELGQRRDVERPCGVGRPDELLGEELVHRLRPPRSG
jgi:hypothetical protein